MNADRRKISQLEAEVSRLKTELCKDTERKLIDAENRLQTIADNLPTGQLYQYMYNTRTGEMCMPYFGSNKWEDKLGISMDEASRDITKVLSMYHPDDLPLFIKKVEHSAKNMTIFEMEIRFGPNQTHLHLISKPRKVGEYIIWDGIMTDITEKKLMEKELARSNAELQTAIEELKATNERLNAANDKLNRYRSKLEQMVEERTEELFIAKEKAEESDRLKSAFLANISHEILTPINGIVGIIQFLDVDYISPEARRDFINVINFSSSHLIELLKNLIDASKLEAQQMTVNPDTHDLNHIMYELRDFFQALVLTKQSDNQNKELTLILDDNHFIENSLINVDAIRLRQILNNLLQNAIKFTEKGKIFFGYRLIAPDFLEFSVKDDGIGIDPSQHDKIFARFNQVQQGNNRRYYGTGLGLSISQKLVKLMGGEMWLNSSLGEGTAFFFTIPFIPANSSPS